MKDIPMLFTGPMVRATLDDRKSQTRRLKFKGQPGDRIWVKETFQTGEFAQNEPRGTVYKATDPDWETTEGWKWKPSIFMPRMASRITLEVIRVRQEPLQDNSESDSEMEGATRLNLTSGLIEGVRVHPMTSTYRDAYQSLWESIHGKGSWESNPTVFVVEFQRVFDPLTSNPTVGAEHAEK